MVVESHVEVAALLSLAVRFNLNPHLQAPFALDLSFPL